MTTYESDVCVIGGGISAAMLAQKLAELKPGLVDHHRRSGREDLRLREPHEYRQRSLDYGENAWPGDFIDDQAGAGVISRTMAVGGSALHWGGVTNRFSAEDLALQVALRARRRLAARRGTTSSGITARRSAGSASRASPARCRKTSGPSRTRWRRCRCPTT